MKCHEVLDTQKELTEAINATKEAENKQGNINSIVQLMALSNPASIPTLEGKNKEALAIDVLQSQLNDIRKMMEISMMEGLRNQTKVNIASIEYERLTNQLDKLTTTRRKMPSEFLERELLKLMREVKKISMHCDEKSERRMFRYLMERVHRVMSE